METVAPNWAALIQACAPILIALIGIIPTIISNRKKTEDSISALKTELQKDTAENNKKVDAVTKQMTEHLEEEEEHRAKQARYRILRFYDELCEGRPHSESHFEDLLDDIDLYEKFCAAHPEFRNSRGKVAMDYIRETYHKVKAKGGFLTHKEE